jgi:hypothetical protein
MLCNHCLQFAERLRLKTKTCTKYLHVPLYFVVSNVSVSHVLYNEYCFTEEELEAGGGNGFVYYRLRIIANIVFNFVQDVMFLTHY